MKKFALLICLALLVSCSNESTKKDVIEALKTGNIEQLNKYLNEGISIDSIYIAGQTPLSYAVTKNNIELVEILLDYGVDINRKNKNGTTSIELSNDEYITDLLFRKGAKIDTYICNGGNICKVLVLEQYSEKRKVRFLHPCNYNLEFATSLFESKTSNAMSQYSSTFKAEQQKTQRKFGKKKKKTRWTTIIQKEKARIRQLEEEKRIREKREKVKRRKIAEKKKFLSQFKNYEEGKTIWTTSKIFKSEIECKDYGRNENIWSSSGGTDSSFKSDLQGTGTGFVLSSDGIVATNHHVIAESKKIELTFNDGNDRVTYNAEVVIEDAKNDIALLKIDDRRFKSFSNLPYGIDQKPRVGEKVFTIGFPVTNVLGNNYKVTNGIVSALSGMLDDPTNLQHSAAIQPGNSGGPLFNKDGNVIGITVGSPNQEAINEAFKTNIPIQGTFYAVKSSYLTNLYNMIHKPKPLSEESNIRELELPDQVEILQNYVCWIVVYR